MEEFILTFFYFILLFIVLALVVNADMTDKD